MRRSFLLCAALLLAGCGGGSSSPGTTAAQPSAAATTGMTLTVTEAEFSIAPATINVPRPGMYTLKAVNKGRITHAIAIEGHGLSAAAGDIAPGGTGTLRVNLTKAGSYDVFCPIDGHRAKGMSANLVVGNVAGAPTVQETTTVATTTGRSGY